MEHSEDASPKEEAKLYKYRNLSIYSSTEWLADNKKKYRQVFDRSSTSHIYAELSFVNLQFERKDWKIDIDLKCFSARKRRGVNQEICSLTVSKKVSKSDNIVYVREGWGNKRPGSFWKRGSYYWEAWIDGKHVTTKYFYIEDAGLMPTQFENPYLRVRDVRLFEASQDGAPKELRIYHKKFRKSKTKFVFVEIVLDILHQSRSWNCEVFIKFLNFSRELKGQVIRMHKVKKSETEVILTAGWGSNEPGSWSEGVYTVEVVFLDQLLAVVPFAIGDEFEEGASPVMIPDEKENIVFFTSPEPDKTSFQDVLIDLDSLIGLHEIKKQVKDHAKYLQFLQLRIDKGFEEDSKSLVHSVFIGNPGTGKTTVAQMMGKLYKKMGLLTKGHVHEVDRVDLVGEYIGQTAPKVKDAIEKARGGVLFIDEAYALARTNDDSKDFGREVLEILIKEMSNGPGNLVVIVAGYPKEMNFFLNSNPGLKSRFKLFFEFSDYLPQELMQIAQYSADRKQISLNEEAELAFRKHITDAYRERNRTFGNARFVNDILEKAKINLGLRVMESEDPDALTTDFIRTITKADIERIKFKRKRALPDLPVDEELLEHALAELKELRGMESVKNEIFELVKLVRYYKESGKDVLNKFFLHTVFVGNPGTGKTTVARILTKLYKALGLLERGHIVETDRQGLVAGYVGQTAIKTNDQIEKALGGVLFIDEAYALTSKIGSHSGDFGDEAIQTILKRMEDRRGEFYIFATGYPDNMEAFLKANPGLASRFDKILRFDDYTPEQLFDIAVDMFKSEEVELSTPAKKYLIDYLKLLFDRRDKYFGNARTVRNLVTETVKNQNIRLASLSPETRKKRDHSKLLKSDIVNYTKQTDKDIFSKAAIGFKKR